MNTGELPEKVRTFVAIYPSTEIVRRLELAQQQIRVALPVGIVKWTKPEQIHLTLQFLGSVPRDSIEAFANALKCVTGESRSFRLRAASLGCFPNCKRPRVIWAGLASELEPLHALKEKLDAALSELGYVPEQRKFHAHLTLGRVGDLKPGAIRELAKQIALFQSQEFGEWTAREVCLMQSVLSPKGAEHRVLNAFALNKV